MHGNEHWLGVLNVVTPTWDPKHGNVNIIHGRASIQAVEFNAGGFGSGKTMVT